MNRGRVKIRNKGSSRAAASPAARAEKQHARKVPRDELAPRLLGGPLPIIAALMAARAYVEERAVGMLDLSIRTGIHHDEICSICRQFVASGFAILEQSNFLSGDSEQRTRRFFLATDQETIQHAADLMRIKAMHLESRGDLLGKAADAIGKEVPIWLGVAAQHLPFDRDEGGEDGRSVKAGRRVSAA